MKKRVEFVDEKAFPAGYFSRNLLTQGHSDLLSHSGPATGWQSRLRSNAFQWDHWVIDAIPIFSGDVFEEVLSKLLGIPSPEVEAIGRHDPF